LQYPPQDEDRADSKLYFVGSLMEVISKSAVFENEEIICKMFIRHETLITVKIITSKNDQEQIAVLNQNC